MFGGFDHQHAVGLVHKFNFMARQQPVSLAHFRRNGDLAFVRDFHAATLRAVETNRKRVFDLTIRRAAVKHFAMLRALQLL